MSPDSFVDSPLIGVFTPQAAGRAPHAGLALAVALTLTAAACLLGGCESTEDAQITSPSVVAIGAAETPAYSDGELTLYESQVAVPFPVRKPTGSELSALKAGVVPYPRSPYLLASDEVIEVNYTVTNLDNQQHAVWMLIDPWNEFVRYKPGVTVVSDDETEPNLSGIETAFILGPYERVQGNIQSQDLTNLALKLDTAMEILMKGAGADAGAAYGIGELLNNDFNTQNIPGPTDPLLASYTPSVVAGLTGFDLGLQSYEPMNVAVEVTVTVIDTGSGKIEPPGTTSGLLGPPPGVLTVPGSK
jgi:hypothetical protein